MELTLVNGQGSINVSESAFNVEYNEALVHQVVVAYQAKQRQGSKKQKTRGEVHGSNKKPWNQKKTGNARAGDRKGPLWRSGGVTFAARPQDHSQKVNKKMYRKAMQVILSELVRQGRFLVLESDFTVAEAKTKQLVNKLGEMSLKDVLIVSKELDLNTYLASRNLYNVGYLETNMLNPLDLISYEKVLVSKAALEQIQEMFQ